MIRTGRQADHPSSSRFNTFHPTPVSKVRRNCPLRRRWRPGGRAFGGAVSAQAALPHVEPERLRLRSREIGAEETAGTTPRCLPRRQLAPPTRRCSRRLRQLEGDTFTQGRVARRRTRTRFRRSHCGQPPDHARRRAERPRNTLLPKAQQTRGFFLSNLLRVVGVVRIASGFPKCAPLGQTISALVEGDLQFGKSPALSVGDPPSPARLRAGVLLR